MFWKRMLENLCGFDLGIGTVVVKLSLKLSFVDRNF